MAIIFVNFLPVHLASIPQESEMEPFEHAAISTPSNPSTNSDLVICLRLLKFHDNRPKPQPSPRPGRNA
jgi:hypothetical protein